MEDLENINYHQISSCANCKACRDGGIDEECLMCEFLGGDDKYVKHDYICDLWERG
jgi:hypothetical protein